MMSFADIFIAVAATIGAFTALALIAKYTGASEYIVLFFQSLFNGIRQLSQFVIDHLPKPLKILLFLGLFALLGTFIYGWTIGATYVCDPETGNVNHFDSYTDAILFKTFQITDFSKYYKRESVGVQLDNSSTAAPVSDDNTVLAVSVYNNSDQITYRSNVEWPVGSGSLYNVYEVLMPRTDIPEILGPVSYQTDQYGESFFRTFNHDIWNNWFGDPSIKEVRYNICYDGITETCTLVKLSPLSWSNAIQLGTGLPGTATYGTSTTHCTSAPAYIFGGDSTNPFYTTDVGTLRYKLNMQGDTMILSGYFEAGLAGIYTPMPGKCQWKTDADVDALVQAGTINALQGNSLKQVINSAPLETVHLINNMPFQLNSEYDIKLVGVDKVGVLHDFVSGTTGSTAAITDRNGQTQNTIQDVSSLNFPKEMLVQSDDSSIVQFVCAHPEGNPDDSTDISMKFETKPLVLGIDILNPLIMTFFILIGALLSLLSWAEKL